VITHQTNRSKPRASIVVASTVSLLCAAALQPAVAQTCASSNVRWASSSNTLYVTGAVSCTLSQIRSFLSVSNTALTNVDPAKQIWLLRANLRLESGATLTLKGSAVGGDVNELRLLSNNSSSANSVIYLRAHWGKLDLDSVKVTSWDEVAQGPDKEYGTYQRAYIHIRSMLDADGVTPLESRMDIKNSEVSYLGYDAAESYGLVWKVYGSAAGIFDKVNVYGDIVNSFIHHNYFGVYTYGAYGMLWTGNLVENNVKYGFDPHDDSDHLTITNNTSRYNGDHGIICSKRCNDLNIANNIVYGNTGNGIMLHRSVTNSVIEYNEIYNNSDAGVALFESFNNTVSNNRIHDNYRGVRLSVGSYNNTISDNIIENSGDIALYAYQGSDAPDVTDGRPRDNVFKNNTVRNSANYGIKFSDADTNTFESNVFEGVAKTELKRGVGNILMKNTLPSLTQLATYGEAGFPGSTNITNGVPVVAKLDGYSTVNFVDVAGQIYDADINNDSAVVTPGGAKLTLTQASVGSQSTVSPRSLWATLVSGQAQVTVGTWGSGASAAKSWTARADTTGQAINFRIGTLTAQQSYRVLKNGVTFSTLIANSLGEVSFSDTLSATATTSYTLQP